MALYETVVIVRQDMLAEDVDNLVEKLKKVITDNKAKLLSKEYWGLRKMAYRVNKNNRGHYILLNIESGNEGINELNRVMKFNEDIIRSLTMQNNLPIEGNSDLFVCESAKDYKTAKISKEKVDKYENIADQMQFDNQ